MSGKVASEVYRYVLPRTQHAVLLAFAEHVNSERAEHGNTLVWPSLGRIAWMTGLDRRTVALATQALVASGALVEVREARYHSPAAYRIVLSALTLKPPYNERGGAPPLLRDGAPPPLGSEEGAVRAREGAVRAREGAVRASSRGGAAPLKPRRNLNEPRKEPAHLSDSEVRGLGDSARGDAEPPQPPDRRALQGEPDPNVPAKGETTVPVTAEGKTNVTTTERAKATTTPKGVCICGHDATLEHRGRRDPRVLAGERPEGECVKPGCGCAGFVKPPAYAKPGPVSNADLAAADLLAEIANWAEYRT